MRGIKLRNIRKSYGNTEVIHGIDLDIDEGEFIVLVGPSGCGKSTLLRMIAGLEGITSGELSIAGEVVNDKPPKDRGIGMVFQSYALYPHMTVFDNMAFGLRLAKVSAAEIKSRVERTADILQLTSLLDRLPKDMSGGQRQRVAIGRCIVRNPKVFLFDEPLSNLDAGLRVQMRLEIAKLHADIRATMVYVTHDQVEAMTLASRIVVLSKGLVEQVGTPLELYHHPANEFVAGFIGSPKMNFVDCRVTRTDERHIEVETVPGRFTARIPGVAAELRVGEAARLGIRPEHVTLCDDGIPGRVIAIEELGESHYLHVELEDGSLLVCREHGDAHTSVSASVRLSLSEDQCHLFDDNGRAQRQNLTAG